MKAADPIALGLPHRAPFIFVDEVRALVPGESAECAKIFHATEPFFSGHFPGDPLVPGVILTEALAQTAGLAAGQPVSGFRLSAIRGMKFLRAVRPDDELILSARRTAVVGTLWQFEVAARVRGEVVAEGVVVLSETVGA
ncbi:MAG: beta-hydroxyacyl-ACP dehydratase [Chthoniobacter sp.]|nr:beta-hydroxyacyl-ACP dehydratase [Chthoniobacter sp.]